MRRNPVSEGGVDVHVPKAGDQILSVCADDFRGSGDGQVSGLANSDDTLAGDDDGHVGLRRAAYYVDHVDVGEGEGFRRCYSGTSRTKARDSE